MKHLNVSIFLIFHINIISKNYKFFNKRFYCCLYS